MGLKRENYYWTFEQIEILKKYYYIKSKKELSKILGKSIESLTTKAYKLNIIVSNKWSNEEINFLLKNYATMTNREIQKYVHRERHCIIDKAMKLGLSKVITNKKYNPEIFLEKVKNYALLLGRTPLINEVLKQEWSLTQASISRYFGGYRNVCKLLDLDINVNIFGSKHPMYKSKNNDLCWSKAELIITNFFIDNNIKYQKEIFYKDYCKDKRFKTKTCDWVIGDSIFVEYFGMMNKDYYNKKAKNKIKLCEENNIKLIPLEEQDLNNLNIIFEDIICN
jgi:hypothetical protein